MSRNGKHSPPRPRIELTHSSASPAETAAIAAAIEQFLRDTTAPPAPDGPSIGGWQRAGLFEGIGMPAASDSPWGASASLPWH